MKSQNAIISWISGEQRPKEALSDTLTRLLKTPLKTKTFLDIIASNPRDNKPAYRLIVGSFPSHTKKQRWLNRYCCCYTDYMNARLKKADNISEMLRIMPNLLPWTLEQRFSEIRIGDVPTSFRSEADFLKLLNRINNSQVVKTFKRIKQLECYLPDFSKAFPAVKKIDWFDFSERSKFLRDLLKQKCGKPFTIKQGTASYQVTFLCNPFSIKMVFRVTTPDKKSFIIKLAPYTFQNTDDRLRKEHENAAIRSDSTYSDAILEFYLKLNGCPHAPDILYYNYTHEVALYRLEKGSALPAKYFTKTPDFCSFNTKVVPDSARLGVYVNDINAGNFMMVGKTVKIIDIGHATFANPLTPGVPGLTFTLGNLCGQDYISVNGVLDMEDV